MHSLQISISSLRLSLLVPILQRSGAGSEVIDRDIVWHPSVRSRSRPYCPEAAGRGIRAQMPGQRLSFAGGDGGAGGAQVMTVVRDLVMDPVSGAPRDITICSTIHSPTPYCFSLFDRMLLLLRGQVVYFGQRGAYLL